MGYSCSHEIQKTSKAVNFPLLKEKRRRTVSEPKKGKINGSSLLLVPFYFSDQALLCKCVQLQATPCALLNNNRVYGYSHGHSTVDMTIEFGQGGGIDFWVGA